MRVVTETGTWAAIVMRDATGAWEETATWEETGTRGEIESLEEIANLEETETEIRVETKTATGTGVESGTAVKQITAEIAAILAESGMTGRRSGRAGILPQNPRSCLCQVSCHNQYVCLRQRPLIINLEYWVSRHLE